MTNRALALASLVMAIPAGFAVYVCLTSILNHSESMPVAMTAIMWVLTVLCGLLALYPIGILIFMKKRDTQVAAAPAAATEAAAPAKKPAKAESDEESDGLEEDSEDLGEEPLFDADDAGGDEDFDDNFDFDEDQEEEAPKKKKKK